MANTVNMNLTKQNRAILDKLYMTPSEPSSLGGVYRSLKYARRHAFSESEVRNYLQRLEGFTQHKQAKKSSLAEKLFVWIVVICTKLI